MKKSRRRARSPETKTVLRKAGITTPAPQPQRSARHGVVEPAVTNAVHPVPGTSPISPLVFLKRLLANRQVQAKLTSGPVGNQYEQEADSVAQQVAHLVGSRLSEGNQQANLPAAQRREKEGMRPVRLDPVQRQEALGAEGGEIAPELERSIQGAGSGGQPMGDVVRGPMENAFGADFSGVKIHNDSRSDSLNQSIQARAFTTGQDIFFRSGEYSPGSSDGQELLAHELTHVVQQGGDPGSVQRKMAFNPEMLEGKLSKKAKISGFFGEKSTFTKLKKVVADYTATREAVQEAQLLRVIQGVAEQWLKKHGQSKSKATQAKANLLFQLIAAAKTELPKALEQAKYMQDLNKKDADQMEYLSQTAQFATPQAESLAKGVTSTLPGQKTEALDLVNKYQLTDAEIAAIKIYTVDDYKYINPAVAGIDSWLAAMIPEVMGAKSQDTSKKGLAKAKEEGLRHAGVALSGLAKLPAWQGATFRGHRRTLKAFQDLYLSKSTYEAKTFLSTSVEQSVSENFANKGAGKDKQVGIMVFLNITNGRDLSALSLVSTEKEILLLPDASFTIDSVKPRKGVQDFYEVTMTQAK